MKICRWESRFRREGEVRRQGRKPRESEPLSKAREPYFDQVRSTKKEDEQETHHGQQQHVDGDRL